MSNTVSTDLAKRLASAGLKWEPKQTDLVDWKGSLGVVTRAGGLFDCRIYFFDGATTSHGEQVAWLDFDVPSGGLLWLPNLSDCLEAFTRLGRLIDLEMVTLDHIKHVAMWRVAEFSEVHDNLYYPVHSCPTEAAGLALLAILEAEKEVRP